MGEQADARRLYEEVVAEQMAQLGPAHTGTLRAKLNLAALAIEIYAVHLGVATLSGRQILR